MGGEAGLHVAMHPDRDRYCVGESIRPRLQLWNPGAEAVEVTGFRFDWDDLAYVPPSAAHLIGPGGEDLLAPYRLEELPGGRIVVGAGEDAWSILPISQHLHLRALGPYRFGVQLATGSGAVLESREVAFDLWEPPASLDPALLTLMIAEGAPHESRRTVECRFTNHAPAPVRFLTPQEDSFDGWVNPVYQFTMVDERGRSLAPARREGTMGHPRYDADHWFLVAPGDSREVAVALPPFPALRAPGRYRVSLTYIVRAWQIGKGGSRLEQAMEWAPEVFVGRLESNEIELVVA